ncbi:MAG: CAP domain-containing protein [Chloroflexota bacterium]
MTYRYGLISVVFFLIVMQVMAQDTIASQILARTNQARADVDLTPLIFNTQLQATAQQHSDDMASADQLTHIGSDGSQFWERMQSNGYTLIAGAENVLSRGDTDPDAAFNQWFNIEPHRNNLLNSDYIEVGIAYARAESGRFYFTLILGTRADFVAPSPTPMPTQTPATNTALPATSVPTLTPTPTVLTPTPIPIVTALPSLTATNVIIPVTETPLPIQAIVTNTPLPTATEFIPPDIRLVYDENNFLLINISGKVLNLANLVFESDAGVMSAFRWNTEFLSQPLSGFTNGDCLQVWTLDVDFIPNPSECRYRHAWIAVADDAVFWSGTDFFTVRNGEDLVGVCRVADGECEVSLSASVEDLAVVDPVTFGDLPDLRLEYPDSSFSLINVSGRSLDLTGLVFRSESGLAVIEQWENGFLSSPLSNFMANGCLQAWTLDYSNQPVPERCEVRHAWILVTDAGDFWRQTDAFTVERDGIVLARCPLATTVCSFALPEN